jgi:hypothetical protein
MDYITECRKKKTLYATMAVPWKMHEQLFVMSSSSTT